MMFYFALSDQGKMHGVMVLGGQYILKSRADGMSHSIVHPGVLKITRTGKCIESVCLIIDFSIPQAKHFLRVHL